MTLTYGLENTLEDRAGRLQELDDQEVCCEIVSSSNVRSNIHNVVL